MITRIEPAVGGIVDAAAMLSAGEVVAFPTETVYGLGADARSDSAVQKIYEAKGRPSGNPLIVHIAATADARAYAAEWPDAAKKLAEKFWPGPLTIIVKRGPRLSRLVSAGRDTVALRCPAHPLANELLRLFNGPIAAPSANRSGFTSPTTAQHVYAELAGRIPLILDGGGRPEDCRIGLESTVIDLSRGEREIPVILRPGAVTAEMLRAQIGDVLLSNQIVATTDAADSPGQHARHYAPQTPAYRFAIVEWKQAQAFAASRGPVALVSWSNEIALPPPHFTLRLPGDEEIIARMLYAALRDADTLGAKAILVLAPPTETGLWAAISDRLRRATEPLPTSN